MFRNAFLALVGLVLSPLAALADTLPAPKGDVILTVAGELTVSNVGNEAHFDLERRRASAYASG